MDYKNILFLDIETVAQYDSYQALPDEWKELWDLKAQTLLRGKEGDGPDTIYERAGIYAEFGKIVCISCGYITEEKDGRQTFQLKSFYGDDEARLLADFAQMLTKWERRADRVLCAHNGKEFDYPYLCRRMIIKGIPIPSILNISGKKPWEVRHLDTMELWKFGDFKSFTSLRLLAHVLGIPSPKDDIDGSMVNEVYWSERNLERIAHYCQKDVLTLAQIMLRLSGAPLIDAANVTVKDVQQI